MRVGQLFDPQVHLNNLGKIFQVIKRQGDGYVQMDIASAKVGNGQVILSHTKRVSKRNLDDQPRMVEAEKLEMITVVSDCDTWISSCGLWFLDESSFLVPVGNKHWVE